MVVDNPILVTGGLGFIGSALVRALHARELPVVSVDIGTYAASRARWRGVKGVTNHALDIRDDRLRPMLKQLGIGTVFHLAAESHVTRSESDPERFFETNVDGTASVLAAAREVDALVVHVSTDEVYGPATVRSFRETDKKPGEGAATSAYSRSKAVADDLAMAAAAHQPVVVARPTNCYGPWQHPEKAVSRWTTRALSGRTLPVWGDGHYVRDWMYVEDVCEALLILAERGRVGEAYNIGPGASDVTNLDVARMIAELAGRDESAVVSTAYDRPNHDRRYAVDSSKLRALGWSDSVNLHTGLARTVAWYAEHRDWWTRELERAESLYSDEEPASSG